MAEIIIMPKLGFNMNEGKLVQWYKKEGEQVRKGENLFSIETDKTNMDIEATGDGVVRRLLIEEGDVIPVTLPIAIVGDGTENIDGLLAEALAKLGKEAPAEAAGVESGTAGSIPESVLKNACASLIEAGKRRKITPRARRTAAELGLSLEGAVISATGFDGGICEKDVLAYAANLPAEGRRSASPLARKMAEVDEIDLEGVVGTGANGRVMKKDVLAASTQAGVGIKDSIKTEGGTCGEPKCSADGKEILEEVPYKGVRRIIGQRLSESAATAPHVYFTQRINLENLLAMRKQVNEVQEQKTSVTDFIAKAVVLSLQKYPDVNASLMGDTIVKYKTVNLGIAVAAPGGLIVPAVKSAEKMSVVEIAKASSQLVEKARNGKLTPDEYTGGTFTISNLGMFGIENFTAIINPPEAGILAVSATKDEPVVIAKKDGTKEIAIKPMMNIQLSADHRVIDGLLAAQFVGEIKRLLEAPVSLMI